MPQWIKYSDRRPEARHGDSASEVCVRNVENDLWLEKFTYVPKDREQTEWLDTTDDDPEHTEITIHNDPAADSDGSVAVCYWNAHGMLANVFGWQPLPTPYVPPEPEKREQKVHTLKTDPEVFDAVIRRKKTFEIRYDDRGYQVGDKLVLRKTRYTGEEMKQGKPLEYLGDLEVVVTYILRGPIYGLADGRVIMGISEESSAAVMESPEPEKRERREFYVSKLGRGTVGGMLFDAANFRKRISDIHVREVLPGDPDPEAVREVAETLRQYALMKGRRRMSVGQIEALSKMLEGK